MFKKQENVMQKGKNYWNSSTILIVATNGAVGSSTSVACQETTFTVSHSVPLRCSLFKIIYTVMVCWVTKDMKTEKDNFT